MSPVPPFGSPPAKVKSLVAGSNITLSPASGIGSVTISASVAGGSSPLTTKGDLYGYSTTNARLPVGSSGVPIQADSSQTLGLGYATRTYDFGGQGLTDATFLALSGAANTAQSIYSDTTTRSITSNLAGIYGLTLGQNMTIYSAQGLATNADINLGTTASVTASLLNYAPVWVHSQYNGVGTLSNFQGMWFNPTLGMAGVMANAWGVRSAVIASTTPVTKFVGMSTGGGGASVATAIGLDVGISDILSGTTIWAMQIGAYNSYFNGNTTFGGTGTPTYAIHVRGGSASVNAIGLDVSTVPPVEPGSSGAMAIQCYEGSGGTNRYLLISYNDAGTQRYKYVILNGTGVTWTESTTLPT